MQVEDRNELNQLLNRHTNGTKVPPLPRGRLAKEELQLPGKE
jgi:hypothetical protein